MTPPLNPALAVEVETQWDPAHPGDRHELREWLNGMDACCQAPPEVLAVAHQLLDQLDEYAARLDSLSAYGTWLTHPAAPEVGQPHIGSVVRHLAAPEQHPAPGADRPQLGGAA